jgi:hypothetical protein
MVKTIPNDAAKLMCCCKTPEMWRRLAQMHRFAVLSKPQSESHPEKTASDNGPIFL